MVIVREFHFCIRYTKKKTSCSGTLPQKQSATEQNETERERNAKIQRKWNKKMQETKKSRAKDQKGAGKSELRWGVASWGEAQTAPALGKKSTLGIKGTTLCTLSAPLAIFTTFVRIPHSRLESCPLCPFRVPCPLSVVSWFSLTFYTDAVLQACVKHSHAPCSCSFPEQMRIS